MGLTKQQHLELYYYMALTRRMEEQLSHLYRQGKIVGGLYSSLGQEATAVGTAYALGPEDWLAPMIRNVGSVLVKGYRPRDIFTQYMARAGSPTGGKDGTAHFGDLAKRRVVSPISMLGDLIPVMTGIALGARYLGRHEVTMTYIGEGGSSTGVFHEGLNFAAVQKAPLVLILENNLWAYSTPVELQCAAKNFADKAASYGMRGEIVDGNDVVAVYDVTKDAVEYARAGHGPVLIEAKTFRRKGHAEHDPAEYVPKEMRAEWEAKDPIEGYVRYLTEKKLWTPAERKEIDARIARELKEDLAWAEASPLPKPELAAEGVYCDGCHEIRPVWKRSLDEVKPPRNYPARWFVEKEAKELVAAADNPGHGKARQKKQTPRPRSFGAQGRRSKRGRGNDLRA